MKRNWFIGALLAGLVSLPATVQAQSPNITAQDAASLEAMVSLVNPGFSKQLRVV